MTPWPQSTRTAVVVVSMRRPDAGVSGCGWEVPLPTTVRRTDRAPAGLGMGGWCASPRRSASSRSRHDERVARPTVAASATRARHESRAPGSFGGLRRGTIRRMVDTPLDERCPGGRPAVRRASTLTVWPASPGACGSAGSGAARRSSTSATRATRCSSSMSGSIKITLPADTGDEAILATLRPGDFFGELALLDGAPRSATAVAIEPTETYILAARPLPRADRDRAGHARGAPRDPRRRGPPPDPSRRGAPLPRHHRPSRLAPRPPRRRDRRDPARRRRDPARRPADPGRPRGDDRLHPAEREQAARAVHRRRADPPRARPDRHPRPRRAATGPPTADPPRRPPRVRRGVALSRSRVPDRRQQDVDRRQRRPQSDRSRRRGTRSGARDGPSPARRRRRTPPYRRRAAVPGPPTPSVASPISRPRRASCSRPSFVP